MTKETKKRRFYKGGGGGGAPESDGGVSSAASSSSFLGGTGRLLLLFFKVLRLDGGTGGRGLEVTSWVSAEAPEGSGGGSGDSAGASETGSANWSNFVEGMKVLRGRLGFWL